MRILLFGLVIATFFACLPDSETTVGWWQNWIFYLASIWIALVALENWLARPLGENFAEQFLYWTWPLLSFVRVILLPVLWISWFSNAVFSIASGRDEDVNANSIHEEIKTVVNEGEREGQIAGDAVDMIAGMMDLHEVQVSQIMTPRTDIIMLPDTLTTEEARIEVIESGHSRTPVYHDNRDEVVGILYAKDLLPHLGTSEAPKTLANITLRQPVYVQEDKPVDVLLREFRNGIHIAIVLDSYGGVAGLVTIEDVIEEIIGEIKDEYDEEEIPSVRDIDGKSCEIDGWVGIDAINERLGLNIPDSDDYDTVGGYLTMKLGRIPRVGEEFTDGNMKLLVLDATDRAVERIRIERIELRKESIAEPSSEL
jgi:putative hemolysin